MYYILIRNINPVIVKLINIVDRQKISYKKILCFTDPIQLSFDSQICYTLEIKNTDVFFKKYEGPYNPTDKTFPKCHEYLSACLDTFYQRKRQYALHTLNAGLVCVFLFLNIQGKSKSKNIVNLCQNIKGISTNLYTLPYVDKLKVTLFKYIRGN